MLGAMKAFFKPIGGSTPWVSGLLEARKRLSWRSGARMAFVGLALGLGACAPLTSLPAPPGAGAKSPEFPAPFDRFDSARPPAYKAPPTPKPTAPPRAQPRPERDEEDEPDFGGILRPVLPGPPWGRGKKGWGDD